MTKAFSATAPARGPSARSWTAAQAAEEKRRRTLRGKNRPTRNPKRELDQVLVGDDVAAAALLHGAIEEFAQELAYVTGRFLKTKGWGDTERIVVGGGFRQSRIGEIAIGRTDVILKAEDFDVEMVPIRNHPDEAGLLGSLQLAPTWMFQGHDGILGVDIGGTNIRCGVVETRWKKAPDLTKARSGNPICGGMPTMSRPREGA